MGWWSPFTHFLNQSLAKKLTLWPTLKPGPGTSHNDEDSTEIDQKKDSLGHEESSPDYVDEYLLRSWEEGDSQLSEPELEQKRLEAAQYKIEGNALYTDGKIREACGKLLLMSRNLVSVKWPTRISNFFSKTQNIHEGTPHFAFGITKNGFGAPK